MFLYQWNASISPFANEKLSPSLSPHLNLSWFKWVGFFYYDPRNFLFLNIGNMVSLKSQVLTNQHYIRASKLWKNMFCSCILLYWSLPSVRDLRPCSFSYAWRGEYDCVPFYPPHMACLSHHQSHWTARHGYNMWTTYLCLTCNHHKPRLITPVHVCVCPV